MLRPLGIAQEGYAGLHGRQGQEELVVLVAGATGASGLHDTDDAEGEVEAQTAGPDREAYRLAHRVRVAEKLFFGAAPQNHHQPLSGHVGVGDEVPAAQVELSHVLVFWGYAQAGGHDALAGVVEGGVELYRLGGDAIDVGEAVRVVDGVGVGVHQGQRLALEAATHLDLDGPDEEEVGAQPPDALGDVLLRSLSYRHQGDDCAHSDDDAQHGEGRAQLVGRERLKGRAHGIEDVHAGTPGVGAGRDPLRSSPAMAPSRRRMVRRA